MFEIKQLATTNQFIMIFLQARLMIILILKYIQAILVGTVNQYFGR